MQPNNNIALNKKPSGTIPSVYSLWLFRVKSQYLSCILQLAGLILVSNSIEFIQYWADHKVNW